MALFWRCTRWWGFSCGSLVGGRLLEAFDVVLGEGDYAILADTIDAQATIIGEHVHRKFVQPILIFAEPLANVADGEDAGDRSQAQAA